MAPVLMTALAAVDIALWDIEGKRLGEPVWRLMGAAEPKPMRVYYSHWSQTLEPRTPERLAELAAETRDAGWTCIKWVLPKGGTETERLRRLVAEVEAVRKGGGPDLEIGLEMWETFSSLGDRVCQRGGAVPSAVHRRADLARDAASARRYRSEESRSRWRAGRGWSRATTSSTCSMPRARRSSSRM